MTDTIAVLENVTKTYGRKFALQELNLSIPKGDVIGVLGPNGSGKSTLFRLLTGLTRADRGRVTVHGRQPGWETNREVAYLPDRARWYPDHTVNQAFEWAENFLPGFVRSDAERLASFMKIDGDMRAGGMSRGQEARLMLILCIARQVPLIILDEPFAGIDVLSRQRIMECLIDHINTIDHTVLISTHEIYESESLFDHAIFMNDGQVILSGNTDDLRAKHGSMHNMMQSLYR